MDNPLSLDPTVPGRANSLTLWSWQCVTDIEFAYKRGVCAFRPNTGVQTFNYMCIANEVNLIWNNLTSIWLEVNTRFCSLKFLFNPHLPVVACCGLRPLTRNIELLTNFVCLIRRIAVSPLILTCLHYFTFCFTSTL